MAFKVAKMNPNESESIDPIARHWSLINQRTRRKIRSYDKAWVLSARFIFCADEE